MPKVSIVEKRIFEIEGFQVDIVKDGKMFAVICNCLSNMKLKG